MKFSKNLGTFLLSIWLIVTGLAPLINLHFSGYGFLMSILAIVAGFLLLIGR